MSINLIRSVNKSRKYNPRSAPSACGMFSRVSIGTPFKTQFWVSVKSLMTLYGTLLRHRLRQQDQPDRAV